MASVTWSGRRPRRTPPWKSRSREVTFLRCSSCFGQARGARSGRLADFGSLVVWARLLDKFRDRLAAGVTPVHLDSVAHAVFALEVAVRLRALRGSWSRSRASGLAARTCEASPRRSRLGGRLVHRRRCVRVSAWARKRWCFGRSRRMRTSSWAQRFDSIVSTRALSGVRRRDLSPSWSPGAVSHEIMKLRGGDTAAVRWTYRAGLRRGFGLERTTRVLPVSATPSRGSLRRGWTGLVWFGISDEALSLGWSSRRQCR